MKLFVKVYGLRLSVFTHWDALALRWCANTETEKTETEYLRLKTDSNRTKFEKSKPTQPYALTVHFTSQFTSFHTHNPTCYL